MDIYEEILPAQNVSYKLGLKLKLPEHEVESIRKTKSDPSDQLLAVILKFLKETDPRPTWRVIVNALRSPAVNQLELASKVEAAHFPDPTSTRDVPPETSVATGVVINKTLPSKDSLCMCNFLDTSSVLDSTTDEVTSSQLSTDPGQSYY